jgi:hypothetical protein
MWKNKLFWWLPPLQASSRMFILVKERGEGGVGIGPASVYGSANTACSKTLITYIRVTTPAPNAVAANAFGTGIVHWYLPRHKAATIFIPCPSLSFRLFPLPHPASYKIRELDSTLILATICDVGLLTDLPPTNIVYRRTVEHQSKR